MSKVFYTSDLHLGHKNIIKYCNRPVNDIEEMHELIITNWNEVVGKNDLVWVLGDITFKNYYLPLMAKMNGNKKLILGNHDKLKVQEYAKYFSTIRGVAYTNNYILSHFPVHQKQLGGRWKYNLHGHLHEKSMKDERYINVCLDYNNMRPIECHVS